MAHIGPLPPSHLHQTTPLTHLEAHTLLASFLSLTDTNPAYRPDAHLTDRGPTSTSAGGSGSNLVLANLRRVLAGIEGWRVGGATVATEEGEGDPVTEGERRGKKRRRREVEVDAEGEVIEEEIGGENGGWQEKDDFEMAQEDVVGDVGEDGEDGVGEGVGEVVDQEEEKGVKRVKTGDKVQKVDKKERKRAKKERALLRVKAKQNEGSEE